MVAWDCRFSARARYRDEGASDFEATLFTESVMMGEKVASLSGKLQGRWKG